MSLRYTFFLVILGGLHFPHRSWAIIPLRKPITQYISSQYTSPLHLEGEKAADSRDPSSTMTPDEIALWHKKMCTQTMVQRTWLSSMVVPGLGQIYNRDYWKVPCFYLGFTIACSKIYSEHKEMNKYKRTLLLKNDNNKPNTTFTNKRIQECARTRNLFIIIAAAWYLLNVLDAYAGGHDQTVNFENDIETKLDAKPSIADDSTTRLPRKNR